MLKFRYLFFALLIFRLWGLQTLTAQQYNAYQFIEPNIAISYDSNYFKVGNRYSNSAYKTEAYDFTLKNNKASKTLINIKAELKLEQFFTQAMLDSHMQTRLKEFKNIKDKDFSVASYDTALRKLNGFSCVGVILYDKHSKRFVSSINCNHISQNDMTTLTYTSPDNTALKRDYMILEKFLAGFASYSQEVIAMHDSLVRADFKLTVVQTQKQRTDTAVSVKNGITNYFVTMHDYKAIVKAKSHSGSPYKIKEVKVKISPNENGFQVFTPSKNGEVIISYYNRKKGIVTNSGEVVLVNVLDKDVIIPFTFSYNNE